MLIPWYVTGFCDAAAAFTYSRSAGTFALYFSIKQREDNCRVVEDIQKYFHNIGSIYKGKESTPVEDKGCSSTGALFRVTKVDELRIIIDHFDKYPLQSKKKLEAYSVWRQMVLYKLENYRGIDYTKLSTLAERLSEINSHSRAVKLQAE
jgi:hypothetical protein